MEYNKRRFTKSSDRKVLHKIKKNWVVVSTALLMALGGGAMATHVSAHADAGTANLNHNHEITPQSASQSPLHSVAATSSSASASRQSNAISQQAQDLHRQIVEAGLNHSSATAQGRSLASAQLKASAKSDANSSASNHNSGQNQVNAKQKLFAQMPALGQMRQVRPAKVGASAGNSIILKYVNQKGKQVGYTDTIPGQKAGTSIDVSDLSHGGERVPLGYRLDSDMNPHQRFNNNVQSITLLVMGNQITSDNDNDRNKATVYITKIDKNGSHTTSQPLMIKGRVGSDQIVSPGDYLPSGYYASSDVQDQKVEIKPDGSISPVQMKFDYVKDGTPISNLNHIYVHYWDVSNQGHDIVLNNNGATKLSDAGGNGSPFSISQYQQLAPYGYYYDSMLPGQKVPTAFNGHDQDVVILVAKDDFIDYVDKSDNNQTVGTWPVRPQGNKIINYNRYSKRPFVPDGYRVVGKGKWNNQFQSGGSNVIYVKKNSQDGVINVDYVDENDNNRVIHNDKLVRKIGTLFNVNQYTTAKFSGYKIDRPLNTVTSFTQDPQTVKIGVTENKPTPPPASDSDATATIIYWDENDNKDAGAQYHQTIRAKAGSQLNYGPYEAGNLLPKGFVFDKLGRHDNTVENGAQDYIDIKKASPSDSDAGNSDGRITVTYLLDGKTPEGTASTSQPVGTAFNSSDFCKNHVPKGFYFKRILSGGFVNSYAKNPQNIFVVVSKNKPSGHNSDSDQAEAQVEYFDPKAKKQIGSDQVISGKANSPITPSDWVKYEKVLVPSDYHFTGFAPGHHDTKLINGSTNILYVAPNGSNPDNNAKGTIDLQFMDNGRSVGSGQVTGTPGSAFNVSDYENTNYGMPANDKVVNVPHNITKFTNGTQSIEIDVAPQQNPVSDGSIDVRFRTSDNSDYHDYTVKGPIGSAFNVNDYESTKYGMPSDYHVIDVTNDTRQFEKGNQVVDVNLAKNQGPQPTQQNGSVDIHFMYNGRELNSYTATKKIGTAFNVQDYENRADGLPDGYKPANVVGQVSQFTATPQNIYVYLAPASHPQPTPQPSDQEGQIDVRFRTSDNPDYHDYIVKGQIGSDFNVNDYESTKYGMPSDYHVASVDHNVTAFEKNPQTVDVNLVKNSHPQPQPTPSDNSQGYIDIHFMYNNQEKGHDEISGKPGDSFNLANYEKQSDGMPAGYYVDDVRDDTFNFNNGTQNVYVDLAKDNVDITLVYRDQNQPNTPLYSTTIPGQPGSVVDYSQYINQIPSIPRLNGYHFVSLGTHDDQVFKNGDTDVIYVAKNGNSNHNNNNNNNNNNNHNNGGNNHNNTQVTMTVLYIRNDNGAVVGRRSVPGIAGQSFNVVPYLMNVPAGYRVDGTLGVVPQTFKANGNVLIKVTPIHPNPKPNSNSDNNLPSSSNNSDNHTPASNSASSNSQAPASSSSNNQSSGSSSSANSSGQPRPISNSNSSASNSAPNRNSSAASSSNSSSASSSSNSDSNSDSGGQSNSDSDGSGSGNNPDGNGNSSQSNYNHNNTSAPASGMKNGSNATNQNGSLPQTGESQQVAQLLLSISTALGALDALGYALSKRKKRHTN